eukprot:COSAG01_NODE_41255_length_453_cov_21.573446_2_plen_64_part_01
MPWHGGGGGGRRIGARRAGEWARAGISGGGEQGESAAEEEVEGPREAARSGPPAHARLYPCGAR